MSESVAALLALVCFATLVFALMVLQPPLRRAVVTTYVFALSALRYVRRRLAGEGERAGPIEWRLAFERLGPTYIKLGQMIASSTSLFPRRYVEEFRRCLDAVPPEPWSVVEGTLRAAFAAPLSELFTHIAPEPLASASIAQVYAATGGPSCGEFAGKEVVIKVQRRGLAALVEADMGMLSFGANLLQQIPRLRNANPKGMVEEFSRTIREELDFLAEAAHMEEFNRIMASFGRKDVRAPIPLRALCRREVLTMERFYGTQVDDVARLRERGIWGTQVEDKLVAGMHAWFQSMMHHGFFHGDVHAGNLLLLDDGTIGFLDFGIIGRFKKKQRRLIADYILAFAIQDFARVAEVMVKMGAVDRVPDERQMQTFAADLKEVYGPLLTRSMGQIDYGEMLPKIIRISARHGTRMPDDFVLVTRQLLYFDRYAKLLAPSLNVFSDSRLVMRMAADLALLNDHLNDHLNAR